MALNHVKTPCSPDEVFEHLLDPHEYPEWLLGASRVRTVEDDWPSLGSAFHHTIGWGPFGVKDRSEIVAIDRPRRLELHVRATPLVRGHVTFTVDPCDGGSLLSIEEEPAARVVGNLVRPALDPVTHLRNHRSLQKLVQRMDDQHVSR